MSDGHVVASQCAQPLVHRRHERDEHQQTPWQHGNRRGLRDHAEQWWHEHGAHIRERHLHTDDRLRFIGPEVCGRGVDDARIDRSASKADEYERHGGEGGVVHGNEQQERPEADRHGADANHGGIGEAHGEEAVGESANGDADEEDARERRSHVFGHAIHADHVGAGP